MTDDRERPLSNQEREIAGKLREALRKLSDAFTNALFNVPGEAALKATDEADRLLRETAADFHCSVCGADTVCAPNWPERAVCSAHCPDHMYVYSRGEQKHYCDTCGQEPPDDWYDVD